MDTSNITTKRCTKCKQEYPATAEYFHKGKGVSGLRAQCKACTRESNRNRNYMNYHADIETARERGKAEQKLFRQRHPDKVHLADRARGKKKRVANPEVERERSRKKYQRQRQENPNALRAKSSKSRATRKIKLAEVAALGNYTARDVDIQFKSQRGKCWWCGKKLRGKYHVDHRIPVGRGGSNAPENICITCIDCNLQKNAKLPQEWNGRLL